MSPRTPRYSVILVRPTPISGNRALRLVALLLALQSLAPFAVAAPVVSKRLPSDMDGVDLIVSCNAGPIGADYVAQTASGVPLNGPYAKVRGASKGLVTLMSEGGRRAKRYVVPRRLIRAVVSVKYEADIPDRADLIFTPSHLVLVRTSTANGGIFTVSSVYELPWRASAGVDRKLLAGDQEMLRMLDIGLSSYRPATGECVAAFP